MGNRLSGPFPKVLTRLTLLKNLYVLVTYPQTFSRLCFQSIALWFLKLFMYLNVFIIMQEPRRKSVFRTNPSWNRKDDSFGEIVSLFSLPPSLNVIGISSVSNNYQTSNTKSFGFLILISYHLLSVFASVILLQMLSLAHCMRILDCSRTWLICKTT